MLDFVEGALLLAGLAGLAIALLGIANSQPRADSAALGLCIVAYSFTAHTYLPLLYDPPQPLSVLDRLWGAASAVLAGAALVGVVLAVHFADRPSEGDRGRRWAMITALAALLSLAGLYYSLAPYAALPPSIDFLNTYADLVGVQVYQCIFALWIGIPVSALGLSTLRTPMGWPRWFVVLGGCTAVLWAVWKVVGVVWAGVLDHPPIRPESNISVTLGLSTLILCVFGFVMVGVRGGFARRNGRRRYDEQLRREDDRFRQNGPSAPTTGD